MHKRRTFLRNSALSLGAITLNQSCNGEDSTTIKSTSSINTKPLVISTWNAGLTANEGAWEILSKGGKSIDAVEAGVRITESDKKNMSVGIGGHPDREGRITLDACIMDHNGNCGSVAYVQNYEHPISIARKVMDDSPHVMIVGKGAELFAERHGFKKKDLHTEASRKAYENWLKKSDYKPIINIENHDTIGMLSIDADGDIAGACTTSGLAYKLPGRVGDSPIIGAGLYIDNKIGGAVATGLGEEIIKAAGCSIVVELMRSGKSPEEACKEVVQRIKDRNKNMDNIQVCFLALNKGGQVGSYSAYNGFNYALKSSSENELIKAPSFMKL